MSQFQKLLANLKHELKIINDKTVTVHHAKELSKQQAVLHYQKSQLVKSGKSADEITTKLANLPTSLEINPPAINHQLHDKLVSHQNPNINHISNIITYLGSQREFTQLVERYNPGLALDQSDKIRKTANRVGFSLPQTVDK